MRLMHAGIACASQENSDRFFMELMGLDKLSDKLLPAAISMPIFGMDLDLPKLQYGKERAIIEVFIHPRAAEWTSPLAHACLALPDPEAFAQKCGQAGLQVRRAIKGESVIIFVQDFDGNLYEISKL